MNAIEQFNKLLNADKQNRFSLWSNYRENLTKFIVSNMSKTHSKRNCLIIGSGNSDDLDLAELNALFDSLTLSDIDNVALKNSIQKYHLDSTNLDVIRLDYIGLDMDNNWNDFVKRMLDISEQKDIDHYFAQLESTISNYRFDVSNRVFDIIIVSPIYTQLLLHQGLSFLSILKSMNYPEDTLQYLSQKLIDLMPIVIESFNLNVTKLLQKEADLIAISDIFEAKKDSEFYDSLSKNINNLQKIEQIYNDYKNKYGIGLGDYGLYHLDTLLKPTIYRWLEWPFTQDTSLFVKAVKYKN